MHPRTIYAIISACILCILFEKYDTIDLKGKFTMKKALRTAYLLVCTAVMLTLPAYAYLDPSVATYAIQVIAGIAIAVGAVVGIYWRKAKKKLVNKLGIDENANKEVESDDIQVISDDTKTDTQK